MRKTLLVILCFLSASSVLGQRRGGPTKPVKPVKTEPAPLPVLDADDWLSVFAIPDMGFKPEPLFTESTFNSKYGWRLLTESARSASGNVIWVYWDKSRVRRQSGTAQAWVRFKTLNREGQLVTSELRLYDIRCESDQLRTLERASEHTDGTMQTLDVDSAWSYALPSSLEEGTVNVICLRYPDVEESNMRKADSLYQEAQKIERYVELQPRADRRAWLKLALGNITKVLLLFPYDSDATIIAERLKRKLAS